MTISQFEAEQTNGMDEQNAATIFEDNSKKSSPAAGQNRRNPPARNTSRFWFERFLSIIQRQNPSVIDASFLSQIAPSNEGKLLAQLKFLGVIDEQGKPTKILPMLNMVGEEQKKAFREIAGEAYSELENEVKIEKAVPDDLVNFFIRKYAFTRDKGINAARFYLYLLEKSGVQVSGELSSFLTEKSPASIQSGSGSVLSRPVERPSVKTQARDSRVSGQVSSGHQNQHRKLRTFENEDRSPIQAVINIKLDKDTPKEYWDRVLALMGERQRTELSSEAGASSLLNENLGQEVSGDSAFT